MSFSEQTEKLTEQLIQAEYKNACEKFGEKYNSLHEGYAFLLKEMEEVEMYIKRLKNDIDSMWSYIKSKENETKFIKYYVDNCFDVFTNNSIKELAQVGAVLMKIKNTLQSKEETTEKRKVCSKDCEYINEVYGIYFCNGQKNAPCVHLGDDCYYNDRTEEPKF